VTGINWNTDCEPEPHSTLLAAIGVWIGENHNIHVLTSAGKPSQNGSF